MTTATYNIRITGDSKEAKQALKGLEHSVKEAADKTHKLKDSMKMLAGAAGIGAIIMGVKSLVSSFGEYRDLAATQMKAEKDLAATIKSTGGAAGVTAEAAKKLAAELQQVTNFGDEVTIKGQAMLLTFTNIGKDVFPQATEAMLNMSQKMGTDVSQTAIQLGKALNDPIGGVTALRRVGVQLTATQEEQIKKFVEMGDTASAQKIILGELETEFGGLARAMASPWKQLENQIGDLKEIVGGALNKVMKSLLPVIKTIVGAIEKLLPSIIPIIEKIGELLVPLFQSLVPVIESLLPPIIDVAGVLGEVLVSVVKALMPAINAVIPVVQMLVPVFAKWAGGLGKLLEALSPLLAVLPELIAELLIPLLPLISSWVDLVVALIPAIKLVAVVVAEVVKVGVGFIAKVIQPIVDYTKWIIDNAAAAVNAISSIFGGGDEEPGYTTMDATKYGGPGLIRVPAGAAPAQEAGAAPAKKPAAAPKTGGGGGKKPKVESKVLAPDAEGAVDWEAIAKDQEERRKAAQEAEIQRNKEEFERWKSEQQERARIAVETAVRVSDLKIQLIENEEERRAAQYKKESTALRDALEQEEIGYEEYTLKKQLLDREYEKQRAATALESAKGLMTNLGALAGENFEANKGLAIANATMNTYEGATKALAQGGLLGILNMVLVTAAGFAQVAKIIGTQPPGKAAGGDVTNGFYRVGEQGDEFVMNAGATRRNRPALLAMNAGGTIGDAFGYENAPIDGGRKMSPLYVDISGELRARGSDLFLVVSKAMKADMHSTL